MGWVRKLDSGKHLACWREPGGRQRAKAFPTKTAAKAYLLAVESDIIRGDYYDTDTGALTVAEWAGMWMSAQSGLKPRTIRAYQSGLDTYVIPDLGRLQLRAVTPFVVRRWVVGLEGRRAAKSVRNLHGLLHKLFADAHRERLVRENPCAGTRLPRPTGEEMRFLDSDGVTALLAEVDDDYRLLVRVLCFTGLRWGEAVGLRAGRVQGRRLVIRETLHELDGGRMEAGTTKSGRERIVHMPASLADDLAERVKGRGKDEFVFTTAAGAAIRRGNFQTRVFKPALRDAKLDPDLRVHDLRHTFVVLMIEQGVHLKVIAEQLGHQTTRLVERVYGHVGAVSRQALDEALDRAECGPSAVQVLSGSQTKIATAVSEGVETVVSQRVPMG